MKNCRRPPPVKTAELSKSLDSHILFERLEGVTPGVRTTRCTYNSLAAKRAAKAEDCDFLKPKAVSPSLHGELFGVISHRVDSSSTSPAWSESSASLTSNYSPLSSPTSSCRGSSHCCWPPSPTSSHEQSKTNRMHQFSRELISQMHDEQRTLTPHFRLSRLAGRRRNSSVRAFLVKSPAASFNTRRNLARRCPFSTLSANEGLSSCAWSTQASIHVHAKTAFMAAIPRLVGCAKQQQQCATAPEMNDQREQIFQAQSHKPHHSVAREPIVFGSCGPLWPLAGFLFGSVLDSLDISWVCQCLRQSLRHFFWMPGTGPFQFMSRTMSQRSRGFIPRLSKW
mmetsp:Transcript_3326/g.6592  ORF Transcript_3326/g.6592 Transcript_3326/m.6592 type:complete len:339 (-) Transcript_3326:144-1160(-)